MSLSINSNITSLNAWRNLKATDSKMSKSMEKLSSGLRINRAADDPAGLVISEKMRAQLNGLDTAVKNSEKAINMMQTAEAALDNVSKLLVKIRQLAVDAANSGVNDSAMLAANQAELDEAVSSITRIGNYTQFGTKKVLDGSLGGSLEANASTLGNNATFDFAAATTQGKDAENVTVTVTTKATQGNIKFRMTSGSATSGAATTLTIDGKNYSVSSTATTAALATALGNESAITDKYTIVTSSGANEISLVNKRYGSVQSVAKVVTSGAVTTISAAGAGAAGANMQGSIQIGTAAATSMSAGTGLTLADSNGNTITLNTTALGATGLTGANGTVVGTVADNSALFQVGANENQTVSVSIQSSKASSLGKVATYGDSDATVTKFFSLDDLTSSSNKATDAGGALKGGTADEIAQAIGVIDKAIEDIASLRGDLGAIQTDNLQVQVDSLRVSYENLAASESTIRDVDMTREMAEFTKTQIMMQAGTAMLAQANQMPNNILSLLR